MKDLKPIRTKYGRYIFRSRLEARWAVFFDMMRIRYVYELEGFGDRLGQRIARGDDADDFPTIE